MVLATERVAGIAVSLLVMPIVLRHVGIEEYGLWILISSVIGYIGLIQVDVMRSNARFIAFHAARNELDVARDLVAYSTTWYLVLSVALAPVAWLVGIYVLPHLGVPPDLIETAQDVFLLAFAYSCVVRVLNPLLGLLAGIEQWWAASVGNLAGHFVYAVVVIGLLAGGVGLYALPIALIVRSVFAAAVWYLVARRFIGRVYGNPLRLDRGVRNALMRFGGWHQVHQGSRVVNDQTDALLIGAWVDIVTVGYYGIAGRIADLVRLFPQALVYPLLPTATAIHADGDSKRLADAFLQAGRLVGLLTLGIAGFVVATTPLISMFWLGTTYPQVAMITALLVAAYAVSNLTLVGATMLSAIGKPRYEAEYAVLGATLNIAVTVVLGLAFGLYGILGGTLIGVVVSSVYFLWRSHQVLQLSKWDYFGDWLWRLAAATLVAAAGVYATRLALPESLTDSRGSAALSLVVLGGLYVGVLLLGLRWLRFLQRRDLAILKRVLPARLQPLASLRAVEFLFGAGG
jgi:O-antigen/teichoic acid export membrane protein